MNAGNKIRQKRIAKEMTQEDLANLSGMTRMTIFRLENGQQKPKMNKLIPIAKALECDVEELKGDGGEELKKDGGVSRWIEILDPDDTLKGYFVCAECGLLTDRRSKYCPNCGKKMM